jgi:hypothetical protein
VTTETTPDTIYATPANWVATGTGASWTATLTVGDQERYYFLRILDPDTGRPVAFSSPVWVLPGASPLPLCEADGGGAGSIL